MIGLQEQLDYDHFKDHERILQFRAKLRKFVRDYISEHSYVNSRKLAKLYLEYRNYEKKAGIDKNKILHRLSNRFSKILVDFKKAGLIAKYNAKQYKKVKRKREYIEIPHNYSWDDHYRDKLRLKFKDGKFRNPNFLPGLR